MNNPHTVFFHELGHFIANELNRKYYSGTGNNSISIYPSSNNPYVFDGETNVYPREGGITDS